MKRIDRSLFLAGEARLFTSASAVLILCQLLASAARAQTIWPLCIGQLVEKNIVIQSASSKADVGSGSGNSDFGVDLAHLRRAGLSQDLPGSGVSSSEEGVADKRDAENENAGNNADAKAGGQPQGDRRRARPPGFDWDRALRQSFYFLGIQHAFLLANEESTRAELGGPFFKDYFKALRSLRGWGDGDPFIVNYIGHPMMGSVTGFIQVQNDPKGIHEEVSLKKSYWKSRLKAMGWSFVYSTQFELGLISEASVGNIGIKPNGNSNHAMAYVDLVVTPVVGTGWLVGEDALDKYFIRRFEDRMPNRTTLILFRSFLNPTRSFANVMRGKRPWYRDNRQ